MRLGLFCSQTISSSEARDGRGGAQQRGGVGIHDPLLASRPAPHCGATRWRDPSGAPTLTAPLSADGADSEHGLLAQLKVLSNISVQTRPHVKQF